MFHRHLSICCMALLACVVGLPVAQAQEADGVDAAPLVNRGYLTTYLDNDLFGGTDKDYTNGVRFSWVSESEPLFRIMPVRRQLEKLAGADAEQDWRLIRLLSGFRKDRIYEGAVEVNYGLSLTQLMFTPKDPAATSQPLGDRRYAGWLGLGFSVHALDADALNTVELVLGTTGEHSLAEEAQNLVHDVRNIDKFQGWAEQIPSEPTLDLAFIQKRRARFLPEDADGLSADGFTEWGLRLGTFRTDVRLGGLFRIGFNLPADFTDPRLSATAYSHKYFERDRSVRRWSAYGLFGAAVRGVAHDASLDGPVFRDFNTGNERTPWVGELYAGFGVRWQFVEFSYVHTFRSKEYQEQGGGANFGSVALRLRL